MEKMLMSKPIKCDCGGTATWEHPEPGVGVAVCDNCDWIVAAYNCPYVPVDLLDKVEKND
jgi:hypothetical protein